MSYIILIMNMNKSQDTKEYLFLPFLAPDP
jgi:hypothetical protein